MHISANVTTDFGILTRDLDRFGKVGCCTVSIVDFLASFDRVLVPAHHWASEMLFSEILSSV